MAWSALYLASAISQWQGARLGEGMGAVVRAAKAISSAARGRQPMLACPSFCMRAQKQERARQGRAASHSPPIGPPNQASSHVPLTSSPAPSQPPSRQTTERHGLGWVFFARVSPAPPGASRAHSLETPQGWMRARPDGQGSMDRPTEPTRGRARKYTLLGPIRARTGGGRWDCIYDFMTARPTPDDALPPGARQVARCPPSQNEAHSRKASESGPFACRPAKR